MARLLKASTPMGQMGERVVRTGLDMGPESGFFGREFTASDLKDTFNLVDQGIGIIKEAEPIADYFSRASKERDKQAALKEIAEKRAGINAQKAAQVKLEQQNAENKQLMGMMSKMPDTALQESLLAQGKLAGPQPMSSIGKIDAPDSSQAQLLRDVGLERRIKDLPLTTSSVPELSVNMPGAVDPAAMLQDMRAQRQPVATTPQSEQQQRLVQAARQRVGVGPRGTQRLSDGTYRGPLDPNLVAAYENLEESTGLPLRQLYAGSMPRYAPGTPDPVLPSEETLELLSARNLDTYRSLVRTPQDAALFNRLMGTAIKREGSDFMEEFETRDALEKELFKPFDFAKGKKPRKLDSGALKLDDIRKSRKDLLKKGKRIKGSRTIPKVAADLIALGVTQLDQTGYTNEDGNEIVSENQTTTKAYKEYLENVSGTGLTKQQYAKRVMKGVLARPTTIELIAPIYGLSKNLKDLSVLEERLNGWAAVTQEEINKGKRAANLSVGFKPGTLTSREQGKARIVQRDTGLEQSQQRIDLKMKDFNLKKARGESDDAFRERKFKVGMEQKAAESNMTAKKFEEGIRQFNARHELTSKRFRHDVEDDLKLYDLRNRAANRADGNAIISLASALAKQADEGEKLKVFTKTMEKELKRKAPLEVNQSVNPEPKPKTKRKLRAIGRD